MLDVYDREIRVGDRVVVTQNFSGGYSKKYQVVIGEVYNVTENKVYFEYTDPNTFEQRKSFKVNPYAVVVVD